MPIQAPEKSVAFKNIEEAHENNKKIIEHESLSKTKKYKNYDRFLLKQSLSALNDLDNLKDDSEINKEKTKYEQYKRGRIVYVEFGVNIGNELSGGHFAIVLNNYDYEDSSLLTVVPLSSKNNSNYVNLGDELWMEILANIFSKINKRFSNEDIDKFINIQFKLSKHLRNLNIDKDKKELFNSIYELAQINNADSTIEDNMINEQYLLDKMNLFLDLSEKENNSIEQFNLACDSIHQHLIKNYTQAEIDEIISTENDNPNLEQFKIIVELAWDEKKLDIYKGITKEFSRLTKKLLKYRDFNKTTYAIVNQVITISKNRILKVNKEHPLKYAYVSNHSLDLIDNAIKRRILKKEKNQ